MRATDRRGGRAQPDRSVRCLIERERRPARHVAAHHQQLVRPVAVGVDDARAAILEHVLKREAKRRRRSVPEPHRQTARLDGIAQHPVLVAPGWIDQPRAGEGGGPGFHDAVGKPPGRRRRGARRRPRVAEDDLAARESHPQAPPRRRDGADRPVLDGEVCRGRGWRADQDRFQPRSPPRARPARWRVPAPARENRAIQSLYFNKLRALC